MSFSKDVVNKSVRHITLAAMLLTVLYVQELLLSGLPNIQLTVVLIMVYGAVLPLGLSLPIVFGYVLLDNMIFGSFSILYTPAMFFSWILLVLVAKSLAQKKFIWTLLFASLFGFIYGWSFFPAKMIEQGIAYLWPYFLSDIVFELIMVVNNFITVLLLYRHLRDILETLFNPNKAIIEL
jgi:energy-coupling factor transport system substrate-specific component